MDTCYAARFYRNYFQPTVVSRIFGALNGLFGHKMEAAKSSEGTNDATGLYFLGCSNEIEKSVVVGSSLPRTEKNKREVFTKEITREIYLKKRNITNLVLFYKVSNRVQRQKRQEVT